jgi:hypothetical protein
VEGLQKPSFTALFYSNERENNAFSPSPAVGAGRKERKEGGGERPHSPEGPHVRVGGVVVRSVRYVYRSGTTPRREGASERAVEEGCECESDRLTEQGEERGARHRGRQGHS